MGPSHYPPPLALPSALSASAFRPTGRDPFEMKHTHFFLVSPNGRADRGCGRGGRGGRAGRRKGEGTCRPPARRQTFIRGRRRRTRTWTSSTIAASRGEDGEMRTWREGGRGGAARNYRLLWSRRSHCDARRAPQRQRRIDKHKTDRPDEEDWTEGGLAWHRKSAVIRGENIPGNSLENFHGIR